MSKSCLEMLTGSSESHKNEDLSPTLNKEVSNWSQMFQLSNPLNAWMLFQHRFRCSERVGIIHYQLAWSYWHTHFLDRALLRREGLLTWSKRRAKSSNFSSVSNSVVTKLVLCATTWCSKSLFQEKELKQHSPQQRQHVPTFHPSPEKLNLRNYSLFFWCQLNKPHQR